MGVQTLHDTGDSYTVLSKYDGGVYATAAPDCVIEGIGDEFTINYQADSLNVTFNAGSEAIIGGSFFKLTSLEAVTLVANSTIYLCANIDLSRPNGQTGQFVQRTSSNMQSDNINGSGTSRDLLLYVVTTGASGVISVSDRRPIKSNIVDDLATVATSGSYEDLTNKPTIGDGTLTIQKNGSTVDTFKANATSNKTINITVPTNTNQLTNGANYQDKHGVNAARLLVNWEADSSITWTATEDCYGRICSRAYTSLSIDGVTIVSNSSGGLGFWGDTMWLIKKGTVIYCTAALKMWALK